MKSISQAINQLTFNESLPDGLTILSGSSGCGKTVFSQQYAYEVLQDGGKVLWITTEELPSTLRAGMARFGWNIDRFESDGRFVLVDAVSPARLGFSENISTGVLGLDPTGMLIVISNQLKQEEAENASGKFLLVVDSISRLLLTCDHRAVIDFVSCLNSRMENYRIRGFATIVEGAHEEQILNALTFSCVGTVHFRISETVDSRNRQFRLETLRGRRHDDRWKNYVITTSGLDMEI